VEEHSKVVNRAEAKSAESEETRTIGGIDYYNVCVQYILHHHHHPTVLCCVGRVVSTQLQ